MAIEIERKFRVSSETWRSCVTRTRQIRQAYLTKNGRVSIRVRINDNETATLTIKAARSGFERHEYEYPIPLTDAEELMLQREDSIVSKTRHIVPFDGLTWEIDVFDGDNAGLIIAEVELDRADRTFERPDWLGDEVTADRRFYNADLAKRPYTSWTRGR
jgi:adenylate cyclase